jgi:hypothetical protein
MSANETTEERDKNRESHAVLRFINNFLIVIYFIQPIFRGNMSIEKASAVREKDRESHTVFRFINAFVTFLI